jgi:hypothetical protein
LLFFLKNPTFRIHIMVHACKPSVQETEAEGS